MPNNVLYSLSGKIMLNKLLDYRVFEELPLEPRDGTVFADPLFTDAENGDYTFREGSPAPQLGIEPIDVSSDGIIK